MPVYIILARWYCPCLSTRWQVWPLLLVLCYFWLSYSLPERYFFNVCVYVCIYSNKNNKTIKDYKCLENFVLFLLQWAMPYSEYFQTMLFKPELSFLCVKPYINLNEFQSLMWVISRNHSKRSTNGKQQIHLHPM